EQHDVAALFRVQARRTPDAVAVVCADEQVTYGELLDRSDRLAAVLREHGAGPESLVAIALPRTPELIATVLAVLTTGAAYLPLDPAYPAARIAAILAGTNPAGLVTTADGPAAPAGVPRLVPGALGGAPPGEPVAVPGPACAAYVIHTSGSTGTPKGVVVSRGSLADLVTWAVAEFGADTFTHVLASTSLCFDVSVFEIFPPLVTGGRLDLVPDLLALADRPFEGSLISGVPSVLDAVLTDPPDRLAARWVVAAGEALPEHLVARIREVLPGARLANLYGPTEATVYATGWTDAGDDAVLAPPIGRPLANSAAYVLDRGMRPVPDGVPGELYLAGAGVARCYLGRPGLTAERFTADPFGPPGTVMYRTGDLVRRHAGELHYLGRADDQIKIRGFRVEPGEVQRAIVDQPGVARAAVVARAGTGTGTRLVAYVVPSAGHDPDLDELAAALAARLPAHLVPAAFVTLPELPTTPNGKLDRAALPEPRAAAAAGRAPATPMQRLLADLFRETVATEATVGIDDDFFRLGGDSISSMRLVSLARGHDVELAPRDVYELRTVARLAEAAAA
ncbi:MAG: non-ribosomal peptide synthetase, partial [Actinophytocola sp.]|uniref:non-ribosomal peptide synthetase n=1 Tax=Actinophytocola sp. TaxID=1872138 RepID=UPI003C77ABFD